MWRSSGVACIAASSRHARPGCATALQARGAKKSSWLKAPRDHVHPYKHGREKLYAASMKRRAMKCTAQLTRQQERAVEAATASAGGVFIGGAVASGKTEALLHIADKLVAESTGYTRNGAVNGIYVGSAGTCRNPALGADSSFRTHFDLPISSFHTNYMTTADPHDLAERICRNQEELAKKLHTIILDDIEQLDYDMWVTINRAFALVRGSGLPWGGIRVIAAGDFPAIEQGAGEFASRNHAFEAPNWRDVFRWHVELDGADGAGGSFVHDPEYSAFLRRLRAGKVTSEDLSQLQAKVIKEDDFDTNGLGFAFSRVQDFFPDKLADEFAPEDLHERYEDPLQGRVLAVPEVARYGWVTTKYDDSVRSLKGQLAFKTSDYKERFLLPEKCRHYDVFVDPPEGEILKFLPADLTGIVGSLQEVALQQGFSEMGLVAPKGHRDGWLAAPAKQSFAIDEEVVVSADNAGAGLYKGMRGVVKTLKEAGVGVLFEGWHEVFEVGYVEMKKTMFVGERTIQKLENYDLSDLPSRTVTHRLYFIPLGHTKATCTEHLNADPFVNGYVAAEHAPKVLVDLLAFDEAGSLRSLYPALAHAPSWDKVELIRGVIDTEQFALPNLVYPPSPLFHTTADPYADLSKEACAVCARPLSEPCPMHDTDDIVAQLSPRDRLAYCSNAFRKCPVDGVTMRMDDFKGHARLTTVVMCECGTRVRLRDLKAHREQYVVGTKCLGPVAEKKAKKKQQEDETKHDETKQDMLAALALEDDVDGPAHDGQGYPDGEGEDVDGEEAPREKVKISAA